MSAVALVPPDSPTEFRAAAHPRLLPRNRLRRGPLVDLPLENLQTGNSLFCVGWRNGKSWFLSRQQYRRFTDFLRETFHVVETADELEPAADNCSDTVEDDLSDLVWAYSSAEEFNPSDWLIRSWGWWEHPTQPQLPPEPFPGADHYFCVIGPGSWRQIAFIPSLKRKTAAKKEKNLEKLAAEKKRLCAERKAVFKHWNKKLREFLGSHVNSHVGARYEVENCPRCGASVFTTERRICFDCNYTLGELHYQPRKQDITSYRDRRNMPPVQEITRRKNQRRRRHLTPQQFVAGLILRGQLEDITDGASLEKATGVYQILCEGWLPRDVAAFSQDSERTIASRAERLFDTVTQHQAAGLPLPQPTTNEVNHLKQHFEYMRSEISSFRRDLCIN